MNFSFEDISKLQPGALFTISNKSAVLPVVIVCTLSTEQSRFCGVFLSIKKKKVVFYSQVIYIENISPKGTFPLVTHKKTYNLASAIV